MKYQPLISAKRTKAFGKKSLAMFLLVTMLNQIFAPSFAYALTSGPTAPEATSFEPIDTTDMVNTLTGNFTYNLPLLEIPSPEGGYPLSLSYHGGIQPDEDASWAGLGWSVNPGAITRNVNGFPDDFKDVSTSRRDYWSGGDRKSFNIGVALHSGVNFGLSFSQDTYQGFGVGLYGGYGWKVGPVTLGGDVSVDSQGNASIGVDVGDKYFNKDSGLGIGGSLGLSTNFHSVNAGVSGGLTITEDPRSTKSLLGASIRTGSSKPNLSVGGGSVSVSNANAGKISTSSAGFGLFVPLGLFSITLGYNYTRYWSDETVYIATNGSLYSPQQIVDGAKLNNKAYDSYRLYDSKNSNIADNPDPDLDQGGTFPEFDNYSVTAQGLGGSIRPYLYQNVLYTQDKTNMAHSWEIPANGMNPVNGVAFRFTNDFSNSYRQAHPDMNSYGYEFSTATYGNNDGNYGYSVETNKLSGSKNIAYFTNAQINSGQAKLNGFINVPATNNGFIRMGNSGAIYNTQGDKQIGGFTITNESGVSYHYALPAYEYNERSRTAKTKDLNTFTEEIKIEPYAYTWYLTAVTGPDFIDRNDNGLADDGDWGYWVTFDYGKWSSTYRWANPSVGWHIDIDPNYMAFSEGDKELYYLDAIHTRTHTALFIKEFRSDAKSNIAYEINGSISYTLGLNNILLFKNDQMPISVNALRTNGNQPDYALNSFGNILDVTDISNSALPLNQNCLRKIVFNHDYSLVPNTANSDAPTKGKYTLLSVDFQGKGGTTLTPPIRFGYDLDSANPLNQDIISFNSTSGNLNGVIQTQASGKFNLGDILKFSINGQSYYCTLLSVAGTNQFNVLYLNAAPNGVYTNIGAVKTKNPPYNKDAIDAWGMYKSDYVSINDNENQSRVTTKLSNQNTDVWSLRTIQTAVGAKIKINYEGDTYQRAVLNKSKSVIINSATFNYPANSVTFTLQNLNNLNIAEIYRLGQRIDAVMLVSQYYTGYNYAKTEKNVYSLSDFPPSTVTSVNPIANTITVLLPSGFYASLNSTASVPPKPGWTAAVTNSFLTGNIESSTIGSIPGGGIRVKDIAIDDVSGSVRKTTYDYNMFDPSSSNPKISSGVTAYEPVTLDIDNIYSFLNSSNPTEATAIKNYHRYLYKGANNVLALSRNAPAPGVMYEYITVSDANVIAGVLDVPIAGKVTYQYRVFNKGMIGITQYQNNSPNAYYSYKNLSLKDFTSQVGNLIRVIRFDDKGNKIAETINHYLNDDIVDKAYDIQASNYEMRVEQYNYQGVIQERYGDGRLVTVNGTSVHKVTMSGRDEYPIIGTGTTQIDYINGNTVNRQDLAFDFYSGTVIKTLNWDSYGNRFLNVVTPAYRQYPAMGLRNANGTGILVNKNMLTQEATNYTYAVDYSNNPIGVVSGAATTWSNTVPVLDPDGNLSTFGQSDIWRSLSSYSWLATGSSANNLTPVASFTGFFDTGGSSNPAWKKTSEISKYNVFSNALETKDINSNYAASRMGYSNSKIVLTGAAARFDEISYAGAEDALLADGSFSCKVAAGQGTVLQDSTRSHTGVRTLQVGASNTGFTYTIPLSQLTSPRQNYSVEVWVKASAADAAQINLCYQVGSGAVKSGQQQLSKSAAGWYLLELQVPASEISGTGNLAVWCKNNSGSTVYFDDFRFQPTSASTTAYVYDVKTGELTYILDNNNIYTRFQYDAIGRLIRVYKEVLGKGFVPRVKSINYNYGRVF